MTADELEDLAFLGGELPEGLTNAQTMLFLEFRALYQFAAQTHMGAEQGRREKNRILAAFRAQEGKEREFKTLWENHAALWKRIEAAAMSYREGRSLQTADAFVEAVYGCRMKEADK